MFTRESWTLIGDFRSCVSTILLVCFCYASCQFYRSVYLFVFSWRKPQLENTWRWNSIRFWALYTGPLPKPTAILSISLWPLHTFGPCQSPFSLPVRCPHVAPLINSLEACPYNLICLFSPVTEQLQWSNKYWVPCSRAPQQSMMRGVRALIIASTLPHLNQPSSGHRPDRL